MWGSGQAARTGFESSEAGGAGTFRAAEVATRRGNLSSAPFGMPSPPAFPHMPLIVGRRHLVVGDAHDEAQAVGQHGQAAQDLNTQHNGAVPGGGGRGWGRGEEWFSGSDQDRTVLCRLLGRIRRVVLHSHPALHCNHTPAHPPPRHQPSLHPPQHGPQAQRVRSARPDVEAEGGDEEEVGGQAPPVHRPLLGQDVRDRTGIICNAAGMVQLAQTLGLHRL